MDDTLPMPCSSFNQVAQEVLGQADAEAGEENVGWVVELGQAREWEIVRGGEQEQASSIVDRRSCA